MSWWQLGIDDPFAAQLAADARLSPTDYTDDQVWELALGTPGSPALALQTNYGGRVGLASLVPMWRIDNRPIYQYQAYTTPPEIHAFAPAYVEVMARLTPTLALRAEFWVIESHAVGARLTLKNSGKAVAVGVDLVGFLAAQGKELKPTLLAIANGRQALSFGRLADLSPVIVLEGAADGSGSTLHAELTVAARGQAIVRWVHAGLSTPKESLALAQQSLAKKWDAPLRRIDRAASAIPTIETDSADLDATIAFSYQQLIQSFLKPTASLPYASFVGTRQPGYGYSPRHDGTDQPRSWSGQNPLLAYLSALAIAPISPDLAQGVVRNYLAVQRSDGWIDWKPGLAGQQAGMLCLPILARLTWGIWQYSEDDAFLSETFPGLLRFFERWLTSDADGDGFPEWSSEAQTGYPFMPSFARGLPWGQNADIRYFETPDLLAYLLSEAISLREIAYYLRRDADVQRLEAQAKRFGAQLDALWNAADGHYVYRDRDTHLTTTSVTVLDNGRADEDHLLALPLTPPNRLIVEITGGIERPPKLKLHLSGLDADGKPVTEETEDILWTQSRGVYTSRAVFSQIDRLRVEGLARVYHVSAKTVATNGFDLNGLLPLWSVGIDAERAAALVQHLTNPDEFWRANGVQMLSAQDPYYNPARAEGSVGIWLFWNTLIGEGLIEYGFHDSAANLTRRLLSAQTSVLRGTKAFYEFYHADEPRGLGERGSSFGLAPLHLLLRVIGVRIISKTRVWTGGDFQWGSPVTVTQYGVTVRRSAQGTEIRFPSSETVNLAPDALWQEVKSK